MKMADLNTTKLFERQMSVAEQEFIDQGAARVIHSDANIEIIQILTYDAARFFGKNGKWSFLQSETTFDHYISHCPIYILQSRNFEAAFYQPYKVGQFMDRENKRCSQTLVILFSAMPRSFIKTILSLNGLYLENVVNPDVDLQLTAVQQNPMAIQFIDSPAPLVQFTALQKNPLVINWIEPREAIPDNLWEKYKASYYAAD